MKRSVMTLKGTPVVPCLFLIGTVIFWFLMILTDNGTWVAEISGLSFANLNAFEVYLRILSLASPLLFFIAVLFLAEKSVYWVFLPLLLPVVTQLSQYAYNFEEPDLLLDFPIQFSLPFLLFILFALTVLEILPSKWILFGFCVAAALLPLILTACGVGEYCYSATTFDYTSYSYVRHDLCEWSDALSLGTNALAVGTLVFYLQPAEKTSAV